MSFFFQYLVKLSISLALVYLFYQLILRRLTFYNYNRWYLLGYSFLSFFIAFINISPVLEKNALAEASVIRWVPVIYSQTGSANDSSVNFFSAWNLISLVLIAGMLILLARLLIQFVSFHRMMRKAELISEGKLKLYQVNDKIIPFSFGGSIFINRNLHSKEELQEIIRHEFIHVRQHHSIDIIWSEILCLLNWYNPFAWLLKSSIRQNLEFIADNKVLENGVNKKEYQYLLLKVIGNNQYSIATPFNFSSLKKRIAMMNKLRSAKVNLLRFLFVLPLLAVILVSFRKEIGDTIKRHKPSAVLPVTPFTDTVPPATGLNSKGYYIHIKGKEGERVVVIKDKNHKEVNRLLLTDWEKRSDYYTNLYGPIPPPPPPPPPSRPGEPPAEKMVEGVPLAPDAPELIESVVEGVPLAPSPSDNNSTNEFLKRNPTIKEVGWVYNRDNTAAIIHLNMKDGSSERYNLNKEKEKKEVERKYGQLTGILPAPPLSSIQAEGINLSRVSSEYEITDKEAVVKLKSGKVEKYDLTDKKERKDFEAKYGRIVSATATTLAPVAVVGAVNGNVSVTAAPTDIGSGHTVSVAEAPIASTAPSPARGITGSIGTTVIAPMAADEPVVIDDYGYTITGKEDILVVINRKTTRQELDEHVKNMKKVGVDLDYDEIEYNSKGELIAISGTMKTADGRSNFVANDFSTLILAMIKKGEKSYFKVSVTNRKQVI